MRKAAVALELQVSSLSFLFKDVVCVENGDIRKKSQKNLMRLSGVKQVY